MITFWDDKDSGGEVHFDIKTPSTRRPQTTTTTTARPLPTRRPFQPIIRTSNTRRPVPTTSTRRTFVTTATTTTPSPSPPPPSFSDDFRHVATSHLSMRFPHCGTFLKKPILVWSNNKCSTKTHHNVVNAWVNVKWQPDDLSDSGTYQPKPEKFECGSDVSG